MLILELCQMRLTLCLVHNDIVARLRSQETLLRIIELSQLGQGRDTRDVITTLDHYFGQLAESTNRVVGNIGNIGQVSTHQGAQRQPVDLGPAQSTLPSTATEVANWWTSISHEQSSATVSQGTPYSHRSAVEHRTSAYAPLVPRPNCTSADGSLTGFSGTSGPSHQRDFANSAMDESLISPEPGQSVDADQFSLPSRSDRSNQVNTHYEDTSIDILRGRNSATAGPRDTPSTTARIGTVGALAAQRGDRRANPSIGFPTYASHQIANGDYPGQTQPPVTWNPTDSRRVVRQHQAEPISYAAYPTSLSYPLGGTSYGHGLYRNPNGGMQQGNTEAQDVPMNLDQSPPLFPGHESNFPSYG
ncbi:hypothetical protein Hte_004202 [Hypoxylon texense]